MSDLDQINALDSGVAEAINAGDAAAVSEHYTDDPAILPPGAGRMDGKEAIQGYRQAGIDAGLREVSIVASSVDVTGDSSVTVGTLSGKMGGRRAYREVHRHREEDRRRLEDSPRHLELRRLRAALAGRPDPGHSVRPAARCPSR